MWLNLAPSARIDLWDGIYDYAHTLDVLSQRTELDALKKLDFKAIWQRELIQFRGDGFGANCINISVDSQIHVRGQPRSQYVPHLPQVTFVQSLM